MNLSPGLKLWVILLISILLLSCHSEYVSLNYDVFWGSQWNLEKSHIAFVASKTAYRSAGGVAAFPDGGISKYLLENVGLYILNPENKQMKLIINFNDLTEWIGTARTSWNCEIVFFDSVIYYHILPASDWNRRFHGSYDSLKLESLKEKYNKTYLINIIQDNKVAEVDSAVFFSVYQKYSKTNKVDLNELNKKLSEVPLAAWGLVVKEIYPKSDKDYITETIYRRNNSPMTHRAVVEQIIAKMNKQEIKDLLKKMDEYKNSLKGLKKTEYEIYSKDIYERIQGLL
jgi:hypothetical protein